MNKQVRQTTSAVLGTVLAVCSVAGLASADTINTTGPGSQNSVNSSVTDNSRVTNRNNVSLSCGETYVLPEGLPLASVFQDRIDQPCNDQKAVTGDANVSGNTTGGAAVSGAVQNNNSTQANVSVSNAAQGNFFASAPMTHSGAISNTGPGSQNSVSYSVTDNQKTTNDNCVNVQNSSEQEATSGSANVSGNTTGGSAVTGAAQNNNGTNFSVTLSN